MCTCHVVVHPVEHDLWGSVPPGGYIARHFIICVPCQTKIQDLRDKGIVVFFFFFLNRTDTESKM